MKGLWLVAVWKKWQIPRNSWSASEAFPVKCKKQPKNSMALSTKMRVKRTDEGIMFVNTSHKTVKVCFYHFAFSQSILCSACLLSLILRVNCNPELAWCAHSFLTSAKPPQVALNSFSTSCCCCIFFQNFLRLLYAFHSHLSRQCHRIFLVASCIWREKLC